MSGKVVQLGKVKSGSQDVFEVTWRCKGLGDGCATINELAMRLEQAAKQLREMAAAGVQLKEAISDDYGYLTCKDPDQAARFGMHNAP